MSATVTLPLEQERREAAEPVEIMTTAELAECSCPEWCERDHDRD